jgi:hypothetical protein
MGNRLRSTYAWPQVHSQAYKNPSNIGKYFTATASTIMSSACNVSSYLLNMHSIMNPTNAGGYIDVTPRNNTDSVTLYLAAGQEKVIDCSSIGGDNTTIPVIIFGVK